MYTCETCGFKTGRVANFKRHQNRKNPCVNVTGCNEIPSFLTKNVTKNEQNVTECNEIPSNVTKNVTVPKGNFCEICQISFTNRQSKYRHKLKANCKPPPTVCQPIVETSELHVQEEEFDDGTTCPYCDKEFSRVDNLKRHMVRCSLKQSGGNINNTTNNNINNNTTNNTNCHNTTNNITIHYNSYDRPSIDHVTKEHVKDLYLGNNRNLKKLIYAGVCEIWKKKENNSFKLPFQKKNGKVKVPKKIFRDNEPVEVYADGKERLFPADHVVEVVLQKAAEVCESYLRQHYNEETIPGRGVLIHADVLEELACNFQEVWDDDKSFRSGYKPFVRTALIECMREKEEIERKNAYNGDNGDNGHNGDGANGDGDNGESEENSEGEGGNYLSNGNW